MQFNSHSRESKEEKDVSECSDEDYSKGIQKRKSKLPSKGEVIEEKDKDKETVSIFQLIVLD